MENVICALLTSDIWEFAQHLGLFGFNADH